MKESQYDYDDPNIPEEYYESEEWMAYEQSIKDYEESLTAPQMPRKPMLIIDHNIRALREEQRLPYTAIVKIDRFINLKINLFAESDYKRGSFVCDIFRDSKERYHKNMIMDSSTSMSNTQYKVWDTLTTMLVYDQDSNKMRRAKMYEPGNADKHTNEFAYFDIWNNNNLIWACIILNDSIMPMKFFNFGDMISLSASWKNRESIDEFCESRLKKLWKS